MKDVNALYIKIVSDLKLATKSKYMVDADEKDPKYKCYGVRIPQVREIIKRYKKEILELNLEDRVNLAEKLLESEMGEEQTIAFFVLENSVDYYNPKNLSLLNGYVKLFHGWSKIDGFAGGLIQKLLLKYPKEMLKIIEGWNRSDNYWERRASVVAFTRKIGLSGKFTDVALRLCNNIIKSKEDMVQKGIGWCLKDILRGDKEKVLNYIRKIRADVVSSVIVLYALRDLSPKERQGVLSIKPVRYL